MLIFADAGVIDDNVRVHSRSKRAASLPVKEQTRG